MIAGDGDRERAAARLRDHYVHGRLTTDELESRTERILHARSRADLRLALSGLPGAIDPAFAAAGRTVGRVAMLAGLTIAYVFFSFALLFILGLTLLIHGGSDSLLLGFLVVWLVPTYLLSRVWRRKEGR
jgi:uncharacterized protein DUF1707